LKDEGTIYDPEGFNERAENSFVSPLKQDMGT